MRMTENGMNVRKDLFRVRYTGKAILTYLLSQPKGENLASLQSGL